MRLDSSLHTALYEQGCLRYPGPKTGYGHLLGLTLVCKNAHIGLFSPRGGRAAGGSAGRRWFARLASEFHHMRASGVSYVPTGRPILKK